MKLCMTSFSPLYFSFQWRLRLFAIIMPLLTGGEGRKGTDYWALLWSVHQSLCPMCQAQKWCILWLWLLQKTNRKPRQCTCTALTHGLATEQLQVYTWQTKGNMPLYGWPPACECWSVHSLQAISRPLYMKPVGEDSYIPWQSMTELEMEPTGQHNTTAYQKWPKEKQAVIRQGHIILPPFRDITPCEPEIFASML